jgi:hypothetical protein
MSMENAILELAAAIRELAGSGQRITGMAPALAAPCGAAHVAVNEVSAQQQAEQLKPDAELEEAVQKVEAAAKEEKKADKPVPKKEEVKAETKVEEPASAAEAIDYKTQVYPKLVELGKGKGRAAVVGLLAEFDAKNGDQLKPEQYSAVLARAAELVA